MSLTQQFLDEVRKAPRAVTHVVVSPEMLSALRLTGEVRTRLRRIAKREVEENWTMTREPRFVVKEGPIDGVVAFVTH